VGKLDLGMEMDRQQCDIITLILMGIAELLLIGVVLWAMIK
jgi:predicted nucleic acid-binding Zn ribbon protein